MFSACMPSGLLTPVIFSLAIVSVHERNKYRNFVHYVSNETSWPSGLFYSFSRIFA